MDLIPLNEGQISELEQKLDAHDQAHIGYRRAGRVSLGLFDGGRLVGGVDACMTAYHILYVCTLFVEATHRRRGVGRQLMEELERRGKALGADMVRLDTFDWQGKAFYEAIGYEAVGQYHNARDGFSEHFFLKRL